jgi:hypothetical protein
MIKTKLWTVMVGRECDTPRLVRLRCDRRFSLKLSTPLDLVHGVV